jgi:hypothetical protein
MPNIKSYGDLMVSDSQNTRVAPLFLGSGATALSVTMGADGRLHLGHKHGRPSVQSLRPGYSYRAWPMPSLYHRHELGRSNTSIAV